MASSSPESPYCFMKAVRVYCKDSDRDNSCFQFMVYHPFDFSLYIKTIKLEKTDGICQNLRLFLEYDVKSVGCDVGGFGI